MGSDFAHVGLGSPNLPRLHQQLSGQTTGAVDPAVSQVSPFATSFTPPEPPDSIPADGASEGYVIVRLLDTNGHPVSGKTVTLDAQPSGNVTITPASGISADDNGAVVFTVKNLSAETVTFTAHDTTDGLQVTETADVPFSVPSAAGAGIIALPSTVNANGTDTATITVTLKDALNRGTPGKEVTLSQGGGHSTIVGPSPSVTDANGQITFTATDLVNETITYTAIDVTDGDLLIPADGNGPQVTFSNGSGTGCGQNVTPPAGMNGFTVTPFATGFATGALFFSNVNYGSCSGVTAPAFLGDAVYVLDFFNGSVYQFPPTGGAVSSANLLTTVGPTLGWPVVGKDGKLYATRTGTGGNFDTGIVVELDPDTGAILRTLASNLTCPAALAVDPLSGDLFFGDECFGAGSDDPHIFRVRNPASATPTLEPYAALPTSPTGQIAFAPNGTIYAVAGYTQQHPQIVRVSGTDGPATPTVAPVDGATSNFWLSIAGVDANGEATTLITLNDNNLELTDITTSPAVNGTVLATNMGGGTIGPDGCLYSAASDVVYRLTDPSGGCTFPGVSGGPSLTLTPAIVSPDPQQGTAKTFTATFHNVAVPADTPVVFEVTGANAQFQQARTDASGTATFTYTAFAAGTDTVTALATLNGDDLRSNQARVTWTPGAHTTFLTLNPSLNAGKPGEPVAVTASLTDSSADPTAPIMGETVHFVLGTAQCDAVTDASGLASCQLTPTTPGLLTLNASFAGSGGLVPAADSTAFNVVGGAALGDFVGYAAAPVKGTKFLKFGAVTLTDELGTGGYDVVKPFDLAAPADEGLGFTDPDVQLEAYAIKAAKGSPKFAPAKDVNVVNGCGSLFVTEKKPVTLLAPTTADPAQAVSPPDPADHNVDHFLCYQVKVQKKRGDGTAVPGFAKGTQVDATDVSDPLTTRRYDLKKLLWACNPVATSGSPKILAGPTKGADAPITSATVRNPSSHLLCYKASLAKAHIDQNGCGAKNAKDKGAKITPPQIKRGRELGLHVANNLGAGQLDTKKQAIVCMPASVVTP